MGDILNLDGEAVKSTPAFEAGNIVRHKLKEGARIILISPGQEADGIIGYYYSCRMLEDADATLTDVFNFWEIELERIEDAS